MYIHSTSANQDEPEKSQLSWLFFAIQFEV
jgi:hypothetical protein